MATENIGPVVDADGHVLEPLDTWQKYIDPQYRDRIDSDYGVAAELKKRPAPLPIADQRKVLGTNALRFYGIDT
jgi:hypothetical protein